MNATKTVKTTPSMPSVEQVFDDLTSLGGQLRWLIHYVPETLEDEVALTALGILSESKT